MNERDLALIMVGVAAGLAGQVIYQELVTSLRATLPASWVIPLAGVIVVTLFLNYAYSFNQMAKRKKTLRLVNTETKETTENA